MGKVNFRSVIRLTFALSTLSFLGTTCDDNNEPAPNYVGKWQTEKTVAVSSGFTKVAYTLEITGTHFTETFFQDVYQYKLPNPGKYVIIEGSISVSGNLMTFIPSKINLSNYYYQTSTLSDPYVTYSAGDPNFQTTFDSLDFATSKYQVEFSVEDEKLILKADKDNDGTYQGFDELITYSRVSVIEIIAPPF